MKIAYFTDTFLPQINGVVTSLITITSALAAYGHQITIFAPEPKRGEKINWSAKGVSLELLPSMPSFLYPDLRAATPVSPKLLFKLRKFDPNVIHFQTTFLVGGGSIILAKLLSKPIIGSFHGYFMEPEYLKVINVNHGAGALGNILWKYAAFFYNQCDAILTYSEGGKKDLQKHKVKRPTFVIPNAINENKINKVDSTTLSTLRSKHRLKSKVVLYVGRLSAEKSLDILLRSFALVVKKMQGAHLLIIGNGPQMEKLVDLSRGLKIEKSILFLGEIPQEQLLKKGYYQLADAFATASTSELQPVSIIEAMYFGLPLVGVAKRGTLEMIKNVGLLSQPDDVESLGQNIVKVISDKKVHGELGKNSRGEYEREYKLKKVVKAYDGFYKEVLKRYSKK